MDGFSPDGRAMEACEAHSPGSVADRIGSMVHGAVPLTLLLDVTSVVPPDSVDLLHGERVADESAWLAEPTID